MPTIDEATARLPPQKLRQRPSELSTDHRSTPSDDSQTSSSALPSVTSPATSPYTIIIRAAFERVCQRSAALRTVLLESSVVTKDRVKGFQDAAVNLFQELPHLPDDIIPTPVLISATEGCSFKVDRYGSPAEGYRRGCEGWRERQEELVMTLDGAMVSVCVLLELAARAIEEAEVKRNRSEESEPDTTRAEQNSGSGSGLSTDGRPLSWFVPVDGPGSCRPELQRQPSLAERFKKIFLANPKELPAPPLREPSPPSTPDQPAFTRKEPPIPTTLPSRGRCDARHLRETVKLYRREGDPPLFMDSLAITGHSVPSPADLPKPDPNDLDAPHVEHNPDGSVKEANLRGLVGVMTSGSAIEHEELVSMVLTTFRLFPSGQGLADALYFRYTEQQGKMQFGQIMAQKRMKARVAKALHLWLELHWKLEDSCSIARLEQLVGVMEEECAFHAQSLRMSLDRIVKDKEYCGRRFRKEERFRPMIPRSPPTPFAARNDLVTLASRNPSVLTIDHFARSPEGIVEFARAVTMIESQYSHKLSPEDFVDGKSEQTLKHQRDLIDVGSFLNLTDLIWGIERRLQTKHFKADVVNNPVPVVAKPVAIFEAKLHRKKVASIPLAPLEYSVEGVQRIPVVKLKK